MTFLRTDKSSIKGWSYVASVDKLFQFISRLPDLSIKYDIDTIQDLTIFLSNIPLHCYTATLESVMCNCSITAIVCQAAGQKSLGKYVHQPPDSTGNSHCWLAGWTNIFLGNYFPEVAGGAG